jgi:hypothetical protein
MAEKNLQTHKQAIQEVIKRLPYPESTCLKQHQKIWRIPKLSALSP